MAEVLLSPGIAITETDKSYVPARPLVAGAAIIGPTAQGPAYAPTVVTSYAEFKRMFGDTFMMNRYVEGYSAEMAEQMAEEEKAEVMEQLEKQFILVENEGQEEYIPYLEALERLKNGEELNVCTVYEEESDADDSDVNPEG